MIHHRTLGGESGFSVLTGTFIRFPSRWDHFPNGTGGVSGLPSFPDHAVGVPVLRIEALKPALLVLRASSPRGCRRLDGRAGCLEPGTPTNAEPAQWLQETGRPHPRGVNTETVDHARVVALHHARDCAGVQVPSVQLKELASLEELRAELQRLGRWRGCWRTAVGGWTFGGRKHQGCAGPVLQYVWPGRGSEGPKALDEGTGPWAPASGQSQTFSMNVWSSWVYLKVNLFLAQKSERTPAGKRLEDASPHPFACCFFDGFWSFHHWSQLTGASECAACRTPMATPPFAKACGVKTPNNLIGRVEQIIKTCD